MLSLKGKSLLLLLLATSSVQAATVTRITTFSDGAVLFAADLNGEFNNLVNAANNITDDNIATTAAIDPKKLLGTIAGTGVGRDGATGVLSVNVDDSTLSTSGDNLIIKDLGVTTAKLALSSVTTQILADASVTTAKLGLSSVTTQILTDSAVTTAKIALNAVTTQLIADESVTFAKQADRLSGVTTGVGNVAVSAASGSFVHTTVTPTDVTNLSVTLTTKGSLVKVMMVPVGSSTSSGVAVNVSGFVMFLEDGSQISDHTVSGSAGIPCSSFQTVSQPAAGTHTYKVQARTGSSSILVTQCRLVAYEL